MKNRTANRHLSMWPAPKPCSAEQIGERVPWRRWPDRTAWIFSMQTSASPLPESRVDRGLLQTNGRRADHPHHDDFALPPITRWPTRTKSKRLRRRRRVFANSSESKASSQTLPFGYSPAVSAGTKKACCPKVPNQAFEIPPANPTAARAE